MIKTKIIKRLKQKKDQDALFDPKNKYRIIADNAYDFEFWVSPQGKYIYVSPSCKRVTGYSCAEFIKDPALRKKIIYPKDRVVFERHVHQSEKKHLPLDAEWRIVHKDGSIRWISHACQPVYNDQGVFLGIRSSNRDITDRKKSEEQIIHLASFPELNPRPICEVDFKGNVTYLNLAIKRLFPEIARIGIRHPWFTDFKTKLISDFRNGKKKSVVKDLAIGRYYFEQYLTSIPGRQCIRIYGQDVTERKRAEQVLRQSQESFKAIASSTPDHILVQDRDLRYTFVVNPQLGLTEQDMLGKTDYDFLKKADADKLTKIKREVLKTGKSFRIETPLISSKGQPQFFTGSYVPKHDAQGKVNGLIGYFKNVTVLKHIEESLRQSQERFQIVSRATSDVVWDWDLATNKTFWNKNIEMLFGYPYSDSGTDFQWWYEKVHPEDRKRVISSIHAVIDSKKQFWSQEYQFLCKGNYYVYVLDRGFVMYDAEGKATRMIGSMMDLTEHKNKELELQKLNRTLKALGSSSQAMVHATNEDAYLKEVCRIIVNDCGHRMVWVGFTENDEFKTVRPVAQAGFEKGYLKTANITWADTERGRGPTGTAIRTGKPQMCTNILSDSRLRVWRKEAITRGYASSIALPFMYKDKAFGAITIYSQQPNPFSKQEVELLTELSNDVAYGVIGIRSRLERKKTEEALRQTSEYLESLFNYANAPIICWDTKFKITRFNPAFERLTNYQAKEVIGRDLRILFPKDSSKLSMSKIKRTLSGERWQVVEIPILRQDGGIRTVLWNSANVYAADGKTLLATIAQGQDITARKRMTEAMKQANDELELKIAQRTQELMRVQNELSEKKRLSDIGTLAATVAHELRNPLAAVRMAVYNIKRKAQNPLLDKHLQNIDIKIDESERIISNLLFYSRIKEPSFEQINLYSVLEECLETMQERFSKLMVKLKREFEVIKDVSIEADPLQIKELFNNILNNAYDAVSGENAKIEIIGEVKDLDSLRIIIKDNGIGIEDVDLPRIFEPFFSTKAKGTGLGLAVCHQVTRLHNGRIEVGSIKGQGTSVSVVLPFKRTNS